MKLLQSRKHLLAFFMPGFLFGIIYVNILMTRYTADVGIFSDYFLKQYQTVEIVIEEYLFYMIRVRVLPLLVLLGLAFTRLRKISAIGWLLWTGFSCGTLFSMAVLEMGIKGSFLCLVGIFPQFILYIPAYLIVLWYSYSYPQATWNGQKTFFVCLTVILGILLEVYINPILMQLFLASIA